MKLLSMYKCMEIDKKKLKETSLIYIPRISHSYLFGIDLNIRALFAPGGKSSNFCRQHLQNIIHATFLNSFDVHVYQSHVGNSFTFNPYVPVHLSSNHRYTPYVVSCR